MKNLRVLYLNDHSRSVVGIVERNVEDLLDSSRKSVRLRAPSTDDLSAWNFKDTI